jgi:hypothetical protein
MRTDVDAERSVERSSIDLSCPLSHYGPHIGKDRDSPVPILQLRDFSRCATIGSVFSLRIATASLRFSSSDDFSNATTAGAAAGPKPRNRTGHAHSFEHIDSQQIPKEFFVKIIYIYWNDSHSQRPLNEWQRRRCSGLGVASFGTCLH